jgi:glycosyltransferase involved in cell wall biosynthesis
MLDKCLDVEVFYAHRATALDQAKAGFETAFNWDVDLLSGYRSRFLVNVAEEPTTASFFGCDTPDIYRIVCNGKFDAVLVLGWYLKSFIQAIAAAKRSRIPVLVRGDSQLTNTSHGARAMIKSAIYPSALRFFNAALYVGQRSRAYFENYRYPPDRLFFSPHCVDTQWFGERASARAGMALREREGISKQEAVVLFAGKLLPFKRPLDIIEAAGCISRERRPITVLVAGSGPLEAEMRCRAAQIGVKLVLLGFQNQSEMPACYAASDVLVLPSTRRETWGLVANEALACGRPIIVSDAVGCGPDLAADGVVGRTFPMGDHQRLADAIGSVLEEPPAFEDIQERSRRYGVDVACGGIIGALEYLSMRH